MGRQGRDHCARTHIWHLNLVAVFFNSGHKSKSYMGQQSKASTHFGRIQHHLGLDQLYGACSKPR